MEASLLDRHASQFGTIIDQVAQELQHRLIDAAGTNYLETPSSDRIAFEGPALRAPAPNLDADLAALPRLLYGSDMSLLGLHAGWTRDLCVALMQGDEAAAVRELRVAMPQARLRGAAIERAVQFLQLAAWSIEGVTSTFTATSALVRTGRLSVGLHNDAIRWVTPSGLQAQRCWQAPAFEHALDVPIGSRSQAKPQTSGLYRRLVDFVPDLGHAVHFVFSAAVAAGPEFEDRLLSPFDWVVTRDGHDTHEDVWKQAVHIVQTAKHSPVPDLYRLLQVRLGYDAFFRHFGNPHRNPGAYRAATRERHLKTIAELKRKAIGTTSPATAAHELLQLQALIGGSRA